MAGKRKFQVALIGTDSLLARDKVSGSRNSLSLRFTMDARRVREADRFQASQGHPQSGGDSLPRPGRFPGLRRETN
jgi:hypothetical protein